MSDASLITITQLPEVKEYLRTLRERWELAAQEAERYHRDCPHPAWCGRS